MTDATAHPAREVLADHQPKYVTAATQAGATVRCCCDEWAEPWCEFATHQTAMLTEAGLLAPVADERTPTQILADHIRRGNGDDPVLLARLTCLPSEGTDRG